MKSHESEEMYLETILLLKKRSPYVRSIDIAEALNYSRPSIHRAICELQKKGFLVTGSKGAIDFTEEGKTKAEKIYERHCVLTDFLMITGAEQKIAEENACRIEHVITDQMFLIIKDYLKKS